MKLDLAKVAEDVVVGQDPRDRALDPRGNAFGNLLTRSRLTRCPTIPTTWSGAEGDGRARRNDPRRRIPRRPAAAQVADSVDPLPPRPVRRREPRRRHGVRRHRDAARRRPAARHGRLHVPRRSDERPQRLPARQAPEQQQNGTFTISGTLKKERTGFSFTSNGVNAYDSKTLNAALPERHVPGSVRRPADRANFSARIDHALTKSHTLRASYQRNGTSSATSASATTICPRAPTRATPRGRVPRVAVRSGRTELLQRDALPGAPPDQRVLESLTDAPTLQVLDAFTSGGAQVEGGRRGTDIELATDLDYARGRTRRAPGPARSRPLPERRFPQHGWDVHLRRASTDYEAGRPTTFTQRSGNPLVEYYAGAVRRLPCRTTCRVARSLSMSSASATRSRRTPATT